MPQQPVTGQPDQREDQEGEGLDHHVQAPVFQALGNLFAGQVDTVQEEHDEHAGIDQIFSVQRAALTAEVREEIREDCHQDHAAQEPVSDDTLEVFESLHEPYLCKRECRQATLMHFCRLAT